VTGPFSENVCEKVTAVPFAGLKKPAPVEPLVVYETQLEPESGAAQAELPTMFSVAPAFGRPRLMELFVVVPAELKSGVMVSALAESNAPLKIKSVASRLIDVYIGPQNFDVAIGGCGGERRLSKILSFGGCKGM
jgi:hypothetical protein